MRETLRPYERGNGNGNGNGHRWEFEDSEQEQDGWSSYEAGYPAPSRRDPAVDLDVLDVNLVASLVRWAFQAKRRMGHDKLMDCLELYFRAGHHSKEVREIIVYVCTMAEDEPDYQADPAQECVDLIYQLHGILAGGTAITARPRTQFGEGERTRKSNGMFPRGV